MSNYIGFISLVLLSTHVTGLPDGAPSSACSDMVPGHLPTSVKGEPPYQINVEGASYQPGTPLTGSITSPSEHVILGVLLEARYVTHPSQLVGEFTPTSEDFKTVCGDNHKSAMTHANPNKKNNVTFSWNPPSTPGEDIIFRLTVVESWFPSKYWLNITSQRINGCSKKLKFKSHDTEDPCSVF
ncbi:hypothetical protein CHS0354_025255 [Potamilus streckersoni]|uniref:Reelin domain-containing protein n=1 Tax=Potamilus streckersoni TaxID=2493646 RepID=A0AAE0RRY3_9BIVA|nr:hypothetical protein CHS0354_025255 [Potamilus streckersoni]